MAQSATVTGVRQELGRGLGLRGGMTLPATVPPSTGSTVPVTYRDRSVAKYSTASATSSGGALALQRPVVAHLLTDPGLELLQPLAVLVGWPTICRIGVGMLPGAMQFTRTSYCANSMAADLVNWMTAAFDAR